ncbi:MAG TPA: methyltransferase domain-containing protein [Tepidisphaeraceae bacterium]|jgi:tRNA (cmo5U34)-methyltransferase
MTPAKSTPDQIRQRFDNDVERFSNLETGQSATIDAPLVLDLITAAAASTNPGAITLLDIGCGAGNYTLKLLEKIHLQHITLIDLSQKMLDRAAQRIAAISQAQLTPLQQDIRDAQLKPESFDIVLAAAVLHHLRDDNDWLTVFTKIHRALKPGGSFWISDLVTHTLPPVHQMMWQRYGDYLANLKNEPYRDAVFAYIDQEDTPRPLTDQLDLLKQVGFKQVDVLHKNSCFAAFGAVK